MTETLIGNFTSAYHHYAKDAVHVPIFCLKATNNLNPGTKIKLYCGIFEVVPPESDDYHAVVDPFLSRVIKSGEYFWVMIRPGVVNHVEHTFDLRGLEPSKTEADDYDEAYDGCRNFF
jgi:hypothetical protein